MGMEAEIGENNGEVGLATGKRCLIPVEDKVRTLFSGEEL